MQMLNFVIKVDTQLQWQHIAVHSHETRNHCKRPEGANNETIYICECGTLYR